MGLKLEKWKVLENSRFRQIWNSGSFQVVSQFFLVIWTGFRLFWLAPGFISTAEGINQQHWWSNAWVLSSICERKKPYHLSLIRFLWSIRRSEKWWNIIWYILFAIYFAQDCRSIYTKLKWKDLKSQYEQIRTQNR